MINKENDFNFNFFFLVSLILNLICIFLGFYFDSKILIFIPILIFVFLFCIIEIKLLYFLIIFTLPLCIDYKIPLLGNSDFPTELLSLLFSFILIFKYFTNKKIHNLILNSFNNTFFLGLVILTIWSFITCITAIDKIVAMKYVLLKIIFIITYYIGTFICIRSFDTLRKSIYLIFFPLLFTILYTSFNTYFGNFDFQNTNRYSEPFFPNHVMYATTLAIFLPFIFYIKTYSIKGSLLWIFYWMSIILFIFSIYFSYTRSAYISLFFGIFVYICSRFKKAIIPFLFIGVSFMLLIVFFSKDYNYFKLQPDFTKTIMHSNFTDHIYATIRGNDISSMERLNMWISGIRLSEEYPFFGVGPNNFPVQYRYYQLFQFQTWVSNTLYLSSHNYFILLITEQGYLSSLLFFLYYLYIINYLQKKLKGNILESERHLYTSILISLSILFSNLLFNDLIETNKNGFFFIWFIALISIFQNKETSK